MLRYVGIIVLAILTGSIVNMLLVMIGPILIPPPNGLDITTETGLQNALPLMQTEHFVFPFLAHALGTFVGAWIVASLNKQNNHAHYVIAGLFFIGGAMMILQMPSPLWFSILDLTFAYFPMAWLAGKYRWMKE